MITESGVKNCYKRIFVFTNDDDPCRGDFDAVAKAQQKQKDLSELDINLILLPISRPGGTFNHNTFWTSVIEFDDDEGPDSFDGQWDNFKETFRRRKYKKRALGSVNLELGPNLKIAVKMYCLARSATKESGGWVCMETNRRLTIQTQWICADTGAFLEDSQIQKYFAYGGENVVLDPDEMKTIKYFGEPGLTLMGFKPKSALKEYHNIKASYFIYPDEQTTTGSNTAFNALLEAMHAKGKIGIAKMIYRRRTVPRFVALVAQQEKLSDDGHQITPPGMHMIFLPYNDDIRELKFPKMKIAPPNTIKLAKQVVHTLDIFASVPWDTVWSNPALHRHYNALQALALFSEQAVEVKDETLPDIKGMHKGIHHLEGFVAHMAEQHGTDIGPGMDVGVEAKKAKDRARAEKKRAKEAKQNSRKRKAPDDMGDVDGKAMASAGTLKKLKVADLKDLCRDNGLRVSGKKAVLIERLEDHYMNE